ncbi:MAG: response regulator transcription factor [Prolixibacteraceae bacterium]|jgi:DNA-binding response OmpR family regulator|nr:response regulator transcription factor [Prolixibacteraceae bacterium]
MNDNFKILVAEDEEDLCEILQYNLECEGYNVDVVFSAEEALKKKLSVYDLFLLDVMMGKMTGFALAQKIRKELNISIPIVFLSAKNTENDLLTGFTVGADDYISKPFSIRELQARVKSILKRTNQRPTDEEIEVLSLGDIRLDIKAKRLIIDSKKVELTRKEFDIIMLLATNQGRIFSREEILYKIWANDVVVTDRTVDVNITRLRKKLEGYAKYIRNKAGYGYFFET